MPLGAKTLPAAARSLMSVELSVVVKSPDPPQRSMDSQPENPSKQGLDNSRVPQSPFDAIEKMEYANRQTTLFTDKSFPGPDNAAREVKKTLARVQPLLDARAAQGFSESPMNNAAHARPDEVMLSMLNLPALQEYVSVPSMCKAPNYP